MSTLTGPDAQAGHEYSVFVVEYARIPDFPLSALVYGRHNAGTVVTPFCYAVLKSDEHVVLIDTGHSGSEVGRARNAAGGIIGWQAPEVTLPRIGVDPASVDTVILTHGHFDHAGNVEAFPNATVYIQGREVEEVLRAFSSPKQLGWLTFPYDAGDLSGLALRRADGGVVMLEGDEAVLPGVEVIAAHDTHTAGSQFVVVDDGRGERWVFAGDNVYVWENLEGHEGNGEFVPIGLIAGSVTRCLFAMDQMLGAVGGDPTRVIPFHENLLWERYPSRLFADGLHVAEISLRKGDESVVNVDRTDRGA